MVGCQSVDEPIAIVDNNATLTLSASIVTDDTRVTVGGENFTEVSWEQGDVIRLESMAGMNVKLAATAAGKSNIRFEGEGVAVAEVDTYYAVYPDTNVSNGMVTFNYGEQSGDDVAAALVAMTKDSSMSGLQMEFRPVNALLHVAVSGVESLKKAEFMSFTGAKINSTFTYDFDTDAITYSLPVASLVVEGPAVEGFFFRLPADLDMSAGYIVRLTDASGNVCTKAYNGKVFERGTTTRVDIEWSQPTVTLGEPMTSYSYYTAEQYSTANGCANNVIYFPIASTYANVQNAMITEAGFIVDGATYAATLDTATKSFNMGNVTVSSWGAKSIEAYIKTKDGQTIKSAVKTVHITGLPYYADWRANNYSDWKYSKITDKGAYLRVDNAGLLSSVLGCIISPEFKVPADVAIKPAIAASSGATGLGAYDRSYIYTGTRNSSAKESGEYVTIDYAAADSNNPDTALVTLGSNVTLSTSNQCCVFTAKDFSPATSTNIYQVDIRYAE